MKIRITNWGKHNPKRDQKTYTWLKLQNDIFKAPDLFILSLEQKAIWIFLLCEASLENKSELDIDDGYIEHYCCVDAELVSNTIDVLSTKGIISIITDTRQSAVVKCRDTTPARQNTTPRIEKNRIEKNRGDAPQGECASAQSPALLAASRKNIKTKEMDETGVRVFIGTYVKAYQMRYGAKTRPDLGGKVQGQIKRFLGDNNGISLATALNMIQVYCQMDGERNWFSIKHHDFTTFLENQNAVRNALANGREENKPQGIEETLKELGREDQLL